MHAKSEIFIRMSVFRHMKGNKNTDLLETGNVDQDKDLKFFGPEANASFFKEIDNRHVYRFLMDQSYVPVYQLD